VIIVQFLGENGDDHPYISSFDAKRFAAGPSRGTSDPSRPGSGVVHGCFKIVLTVI
jgi:hypothetical protein